MPMVQQEGRLLNYIHGGWRRAVAAESLEVKNPATQETISKVPLSDRSDVNAAAEAAQTAFPAWRETPAVERIQFLFKLKRSLEEHSEEISRALTEECGKTLPEARGELMRGIQNVEVAAGIPSLMMGVNSEDIARGIDEYMIRQPVGVVAAITPFNFPGMIPLWFLPYAIACGNTIILKPSEKVPVTMNLVFTLLDELKLPRGVVNLVNGGRESVDALLDHPAVRAISFVGSSPVAQYVYSRATAKGKRAQCQGGAKNAVVVMPDADLRQVTSTVTESAFGCAGQRCLAASVAVGVGEASEAFTESIQEAASSLKVGYGLEDGVEMGPVITPESLQRIRGLVEKSAKEGARILLDGRNASVPGHEKGNFLRPTILDGVDPRGEIARAEIFGPVLTLMHADTIEDAISLVNTFSYGNMACLFTSSGAAARKFRYQVQAGNVGINVGVAAPMAFFPFSGWKDSFFGDLHGQGRDAIDFYTEKKVVVERWPSSTPT
jgi:malonate-semialdehyde dehydrogenase (acetylating) / methylmalonate-semialdehyde dehydrogenase